MQFVWISSWCLATTNAIQKVFTLFLEQLSKKCCNTVLSAPKDSAPEVHLI